MEPGCQGGWRAWGEGRHVRRHVAHLDAVDVHHDASQQQRLQVAEADAQEQPQPQPAPGTAEGGDARTAEGAAPDTPASKRWELIDGKGRGL